jgi:hypothetical protein
MSVSPHPFPFQLGPLFSHFYPRTGLWKPLSLGAALLNTTSDLITANRLRPPYKLNETRRRKGKSWHGLGFG